MSTYSATITINRTTPEERDKYGDKIVKGYENVNLLQITVVSASLEKLQKIISAHVDLVEE